MNGAAAGAAAAAAAIAQAVKASGSLVRLEPAEFEKILGRLQDPIVIVAVGGVVRSSYQYLVTYKGFFFFTKSSRPLHLPGGAEVIKARSIFIPR